MIIISKKLFFIFQFFIVLLIAMLNTQQTKAQIINYSNEVNFVNNLVNDKSYRTAIDVCAILKKQNLIKTQRDSLNFLEGWAHYNIKNLDSAASILNRIDTSSTFYFKAQYYSALCNAYQQKATQSIVQIKSMSKSLDTYPEFSTYTLASYYLINRNIKIFLFLTDFFYIQSYFVK